MTRKKKSRNNISKQGTGGGKGKGDIVPTQALTMAKSEVDKTSRKEMKFLKHRKFDFKKLAKVPEVAGQLKAGDLEPKVAAYKMAAKLLPKQKGTREQSDINLAVEFVAFMWPKKVTVVGSPKGRAMVKGLDRNELKLFERFTERYALRVRGYLNELEEKNGGKAESMTKMRESMSFDEILQAAFDGSCEELGYAMDKRYYFGKSGEFLRRCPMYGLSLRQWIDVTRPIMKQFCTDKACAKSYGQTMRLCSAANRLELAASGVAEGLDKVRSNCWECGSHAPAGAKLCVCAGCHVPLYCSKACQTEAWRSGHKDTCEQLMKSRITLLQSLDAVDKYHEGNCCGGCYTDPINDYKVAKMLGDPLPLGFQFNWSDQEGIEGPSMEFFFKNVAAISEKKWWPFVGTCTEEEFWGSVEQSAARHETDESVIVSICLDCLYMALCYDIEGFVDVKNDLANRMIMSLVWSLCPLIKMLRDDFGVSVPREFFLQRVVRRQGNVLGLKEYETMFCSKEYLTSLSNQTKWEVFKGYRDSYHK